MKSTFKNRIKMIWHHLISNNLMCEILIGGNETFCLCGYGVEKKNKEENKGLMEVCKASQDGRLLKQIKKLEDEMLKLIIRNILKYTIGLPFLIFLTLFSPIVPACCVFSNVISWIIGEETHPVTSFFDIKELLFDLWRPIR